MFALNRLDMNTKFCQFLCTLALGMSFFCMGIAIAKTPPKTQTPIAPKINPVKKSVPQPPASSGISSNDQRKLDQAPLGHVVKIKIFGSDIPAVKVKPGDRYYILEPTEKAEKKSFSNRKNTPVKNSPKTPVSPTSPKPKEGNETGLNSDIPTLGDEFESQALNMSNSSNSNSAAIFDNRAFGTSPATHPECRIANLPTALNLNETLFGPVRDQSPPNAPTRGTCTAQAIANVATYVWNSQNSTSKYFSANWIHMRANEFEIFTGQETMDNAETGSHINNYHGVNITGRGGFMEEAYFPYVNPMWDLRGQSVYVDTFSAPYGQQFLNVTQAPPVCSFVNADEYQANVEKVDRSDFSAMEFVKIKLCQNRPVYASFDYYSGMLNSVTAENGYVLEAPESYTEDGGHVMTIVGYDDTTQLLRVLNSWGSDWGNNGYFYMTYDAFVTLRRNYMLTIHELQAYPSGPKPVLYEFLTSAPLPTCNML